MNNEIEKTYQLIKNKVLNHEIYQNVKDYSKSKEKMLFRDWRIAQRLTIEFGKKYTTSLLYKIKQFYSIIEKVPTMSGKLTWSHWYEMLSINDINKIIYYINQCEMNNLDVRSLRLKIKSNEYERLDDNTKNKLIDKEKSSVVHFVKNPILIKNSYNYEIISEKILQRLVLEDIESFMKEIDNSISFIGSEYKIKLGDKYNYIDKVNF